MNRALQFAALLCSAAVLSACSTVGKFDNVLTVSLSGDRAFVASLYGPIGVTAELRKEDAAALQELVQSHETLKFIRQAAAANAAAAARKSELRLQHGMRASQ